MIITRETDYAIRLLRALSDGTLRSMQPLCKEEKIPLKFAYKILRKLKDGGIVTSTSGKNGGYRLIKDLHSFSLLDLIRIIDGPLYFNSCMKPGYVCEWASKKNSACIVHNNMQTIQSNMEHLFDGCTMDQLLFGTVPSKTHD